MRKKFLAVLLIITILVGFSACGDPKTKDDTPNKGNSPAKSSETQKADLYAVTETLCVKDGENYAGETILTTIDFAGFKYNFSESQETLFIYFKLTDEGQKTLNEKTYKYVAAPGFLSIWVGDELICTNKLWSQITTDEFVVLVKDIKEDNAEAVINKIKGTPRISSVSQEQTTQETLPSIDNWKKEVISDKPGETHIQYSIVKEDGNNLIVLDVQYMTEEKDLDNDNQLEIIVYQKGDKRNIGIYDLIDGTLKYIDVKSRLGATWSEYMGNMGNVDSAYSNYIEVAFEDLTKEVHYDVYKYDKGKLVYVCPFYDALRKY
ncbi:hypothetical protein [Clostridium aminobutyricum]|uniref:Uncharacterized protein n=1 Tax=Clostridium aminobutyricum TaxID=33953 RepID=A0A939D677_CLOAM|nr:hypothetical protein [Clostridium aminobutyricum]MBN7772269.1 hypothetical protein [Clostridium aminobutyricum]